MTLNATAQLGYTRRPLGPTFGLEIVGLPLGAARLSTATVASLRDDLARWRLLILRNQGIGHVEQIIFSRIFGELEVHVLDQFRVPGFPEILRISNIFESGKPIGLYDGDNEEEWHTDHSWKQSVSSASLLYSVIAPAAGGDTLFADTTAAYDELPSETRKKLGKLSAVHSLAHLFEQQRAMEPNKEPLTERQRDSVPDVVHPLVRVHPVTGRSSLLLGSMIIRGVVGLSLRESSVILNDLHGHATQERFIYRHEWRVGDLVIWDNRSTMHTASPCDSTANQRLLYRTTVL